MTSKQVPDETSRDDGRTRRGVLLATGALGIAALAGCTGPSETGTNGTADDPVGGTSTDPMGESTTDELGGTTEETDETTTGETTDGQTATDDESTSTDDQTDTTTGTGDALSSPIQLGAQTDAWVGQEPSSIGDAQNPTLRLRAGEEYELVWENLDGVEHELVLVDQDDEALAKTDAAEEQGATVQATVTAAGSMAEYYCEYHPESMRGTIEILD
ncbi:cupredoxin domain-containing protein [Haloarchaeobius sp. HRN-SO-5]|uniref:cupredoxin domain-containing protein n=1 Tax=Haloarchaeobius sp. HRN-SO-5 TaxID=3446118 RepID=UPI003EBAC2AC